MAYRYSYQGFVLFAVVVFLLTKTGQPPVAAAAQTERTMAEAIDAYVTEQMDKLEIPGVAVGIIRGDQVIHLRGYGVVDDTGRTVTSRTPFLIASLSKSITAVSIMQLVEDGKLELDAPVQNYLSWFQVADEETSSRITIRHLLNQTSGFPERESYVRNLDSNPAADALEISIRDLNTTKLSFPLGEEFEYSNTNYDILGLVIQTVSGQSYETYVEENIFSPLDMDNSYTSLEDARAGNLTRGYHSFFDSTVAYDHLMPYSRTTKPSTGLFSSAEDLTHYLIAHLNQGRYQERSILSADGVAALHEPGIRYSDNASYAMGWAVFLFTEMAAVAPEGAIPTALAHRGEWAGYNSIMVLIPDLELGIVVLMNKSDPVQTPELFNLGWSVSMVAVGLEPFDTPSADFVGRNLRALLIGIIVLLGISLIWSIRKIREFFSRPSIDSQQRKKPIARMILLAAIDLILAGGLLFVRLPETKDTLALALRFNPDIGLMYVLILVLTLGWGVLRTVLFFVVLSKKGNLSQSQA
jgi:CubicO group peptidase (beta-lactamase class C family)